MHLWRFLLCKDMYLCFLWSPFFPINSASFAYLLKFSIDFGSIVKHSYSLPPFSKINRPVSPLTIPFLFTIFLAPFAFLPFSSYFFCVLCFRSLYLCSYLSHYLFPNIFKYLYTHVFAVSQYFKITSSISPLRFTFHLQLIIVSAPRYNLCHHLAHHVHLYYSYLQQPKTLYHLHHP